MPKITALPAYTTPQATDVLPIVQISGPTTSKITWADLFQSPTLITPVLGVASGTSVSLAQTVAVTSTDGMVIQNTTAAALGAQQWSPRLRLSGAGFRTTGSVSFPEDWIIENQTVQAATSPASNLVFSQQANSAGYTALFTFGRTGNLTALGTIATNSTGILSVVAGKTFAVNSTLTLVGTDSTSMVFPSTNATLARIDTGQTFTGTNAFDVLTANSLNGNTFTTGTYTLTGTAAKTLNFTNTLTLSGTDSTTMTFPTTSATMARTDTGQAFTGTNIFTSPKLITSILDTNANTLLGITATGSAVNNIAIANAASGSAPVISSAGSGASIDITLTPKGSASVNVGSGAAGNPAIVIGAIGSGYGFAYIGGLMTVGGGSPGTNFISPDIYQSPSGSLGWSSSGLAGSSAADIAINRVGAGLMGVSTVVGGGSNGAILMSERVLAKTSNYPVVAGDSNTVFTNAAAGGEVDFTLPTAVVGQTYTFIVLAAQTLKVIAGASTTIRLAASVSGSAGNITNATIGGTVCLIAVSTTSWIAKFVTGSWTVT